MLTTKLDSGESSSSSDGRDFNRSQIRGLVQRAGEAGPPRERELYGGLEGSLVLCTEAESRKGACQWVGAKGRGARRGQMVQSAFKGASQSPRLMRGKDRSGASPHCQVAMNVVWHPGEIQD